MSMTGLHLEFKSNLSFFQYYILGLRENMCERHDKPTHVSKLPLQMGSRKQWNIGEVIGKAQISINAVKPACILNTGSVTTSLCTSLSTCLKWKINNISKQMNRIFFLLCRRLFLQTSVY